MKECKHEWIEDELFKSGACSMFFGEIGKVKQESRFICRKCKSVNYFVKDKSQELKEEKA